MNSALWWLVQNTVAVALMIPFVLVACRVFRNRPAVQHVLWLVVLLKFVTPPVVSWPWTIDNVNEAIWTTAASPSPVTVVAASDFPPGDADDPRGPDDLVPPQDLDAGAFAPFKYNIQPTSSTAAPVEVVAASHAFVPILLGVTTVVWLLGVAVSLSWQLRRIARHLSLIRQGTAAPQALIEEIRAIARHLGVRPPRALIVPRILSPFVWCLGRLRLVWPDTLLGRVEVERSRGIIAHELAHVRRRDHWVSWLELAAGIVWWWNPLFWVTRKRLRESAEMASDALAISASPERRREYAEMLLEMSSGLKSGMPAPVLAVSAGTPSSFERRLSM